MFITIVGSLACVFGSLRFIWSLFLDYQFSYVNVYGFLIVLQLICACVVYQSVISSNKHLFLVSMVLSIFCEGGHFVLLPSHCVQIFKTSQNGIKVFSYLFSCFGLSSIIGSLISNEILIKTKNNDQRDFKDPYFYIFTISILLNILSGIVLTYYKKLICESQNDNFLKYQEQNSQEK